MASRTPAAVDTPSAEGGSANAAAPTPVARPPAAPAMVSLSTPCYPGKTTFSVEFFPPCGL